MHSPCPPPPQANPWVDGGWWRHPPLDHVAVWHPGNFVFIDFMFPSPPDRRSGLVIPVKSFLREKSSAQLRIFLRSPAAPYLTCSWRCSCPFDKGRVGIFRQGIAGPPSPDHSNNQGTWLGLPSQGLSASHLSFPVPQKILLLCTIIAITRDSLKILILFSDKEAAACQISFM